MSEWPSEDQKEFFYIDKVNDTEMDSSLVESKTEWYYLTEFDDYEIKIPQITEQI